MWLLCPSEDNPRDEKIRIEISPHSTQHFTPCCCKQKQTSRILVLILRDDMVWERESKCQKRNGQSSCVNRLRKICQRLASNRPPRVSCISYYKESITRRVNLLLLGREGLPAHKSLWVRRGFPLIASNCGLFTTLPVQYIQ